TPIWITFESFATLNRAEFYEALTHLLQRALAARQITLEHQITNQFQLLIFFEKVRELAPPIVLVIDEFEGLPQVVLSEVLHAFRQIYHQKQFYGLHSLILVGVSTVAEMIVSSASPFNVVDELRITYFTFAQVQALIGQYLDESGQPFAEEVIKAIYENTLGQPGLVNGLCQHLVSVIANDRSQPITMDDFYETLKYFLTQRFDKNIINIVSKARERREFMLRLLFTDEPIPFTVNDPDIAYLYANGVIDDRRGAVDIPVPLYSKCLIAAFRPLMNGEGKYYTLLQDQLQEFATKTGLNMGGILEKYRDYVRRRGFRAFDTEHLREGAWHYSLDGFINFFIERLGGQTLIEVPSGRGRTDILILYQSYKYLIETKIFTDAFYFEKGKYQLAEYLKSEGLAEGFYVVFSGSHGDTDTLHSDEMIEGKRIRTYIVRTNFARPTDISPPADHATN
ncbi:MAG: hypothetical protein KDE19_10600, partial [Caldilineaceae bacterium]|nr:hypothetical protein [Caldilineaceae bacterium]